MQASKANLINAVALIVIGLWGYTQSSSNTALIPVVGGVILLLLQGGIAKHNKVVAHIAVVLTLILLIGLVKPFLGALNDGDNLGMLRVGLMLLTGIFAMIAFIKSFIEARKSAN